MRTYFWLPSYRPSLYGAALPNGAAVRLSVLFAPISTEGKLFLLACITDTYGPTEFSNRRIITADKRLQRECSAVQFNSVTGWFWRDFPSGAVQQNPCLGFQTVQKRVWLLLARRTHDTRVVYCTAVIPLRILSVRWWLLLLWPSAGRRCALYMRSKLTTDDGRSWQGSVTTLSVEHRDERYAGSAARQHTTATAAVITAVPPSTSSAQPTPAAVAAAVRHDASSKQRSSARTDCIHDGVVSAGNVFFASANEVVAATVRLRFDGRSTAFQRSLRSQWRNPLAAVTLTSP